jgi:uncharacterized metal-binding protein YceD (DUF177 family)
MTAAWTHPLRWSDVARRPALRLVADGPTRERVAKALDLPEVHRLEADLQVRPWLDGAEIEGRIDADVTQICGVSLDPFETPVSDTFVVHVVPAGSPNAPAGGADEVELSLEAEDPPDVAPGDAIDLAAYVVEHFALALDPFPRKPGAAFEAPEEPPAESPFAALKALKDRPAG